MPDEPARDTFLDRYPLECPQCGKRLEARPSMSMTEFGINSGHGTCTDCKAFLHLEIIPDLTGERMKAVDWDSYMALKAASSALDGATEQLKDVQP